MKTRPETYRDKALECEDMAARAHDPAVKQQFTTIAQVWGEMADFREKEDTKKKPASIASTQFGSGLDKAGE